MCSRSVGAGQSRGGRVGVADAFGNYHDLGINPEEGTARLFVDDVLVDIKAAGPCEAE